MTAPDLLSQALAHHRAGRADAAVPLYRALIDGAPENPDLRHLLALALLGSNAPAAHAELRRALALAPATGLYLHNAARLAEAESAHARFLARALALDPAAPADAHHRLGAMSARAGRRAQAACRFRRAIALDPGFSLALFDRANLLGDDGDTDAAAIGYRRVLAGAEHEGSLIAYGNLLKRLGRPAEAAGLFGRLTHLTPDKPDAHGVLAAVLAESGDEQGAVASLRRALALGPGAAEAWHTLGLVLVANPRWSDAAIAAAGRAILISPEDPDPHLTRALAFFHQGRIREAIAARRAVIALAPADAQRHYEFLSFLPLDPDLTPHVHFDYRRRVHRRFSDPLTHAAAPHANSRDPDRRLRLGYVDNRLLYRSTHSTNLLPTIEAHDLDQVELVFYTNLPEAMADDMTGRYRAKASRFRHTGALSDAALARLVREDGIDILIDAASHLTGARAGVFARKPAPIQVTMMQVGSSGMRAMDYAVADDVLLPAAAPSFFTEEIIRLPMGFLFEPVADLTPPVALPSPSRPLTFGSANVLAKCGAPVLSLWARVLGEVPGSRLLIKAAGLAAPRTRQRVRDFFERSGIAGDRLELRGWTPGHAGHLDTFNEIDIVLDCFPYPGMTTSLEAILMGAPVVTMAGDRFLSRIGEAILTAIGHPEWIARNEDAYVAIARRLAADRDTLAALRQRLRGELLASPLTDARTLTGGLETALREAWRGWCAGRA